MEVAMVATLGGLQLPDFGEWPIEWAPVATPVPPVSRSHTSAPTPREPAPGRAAGLSPLQSAFRDVMASVCTPVAVVTSMADGLPHGTTVSAFASLSMEPPMILACLDRASDLLALLRRTGRFGLNVLGSAQAELALNFARKGGAGKFADVPWYVDGEVPRIPGAGGFLACAVDKVVPGGDHVVVMGRALIAETAAEPPLTYHNRGFGTHAVL
jgi:flavin reductase (DIM6/NTAB) family NADH-FMN oxidoreductase RutF